MKKKILTASLSLSIMLSGYSAGNSDFGDRSDIRSGRPFFFGRISPLAFSLLPSGCRPENSPSLQKYSDITLDAGFDTFISLQEYTPSAEIFNADFKQMTELFHHYHQLFDIYNNYTGINNIKTINDAAGKEPVEVDPVIIEMLDTARQFYELSGGEFDITMGAVLNIWHHYREKGLAANEEGKTGALPDMAELQEARLHTGWDKVEIDYANNTVYINDPKASLDVGGIAKGYATELVARALPAAYLTGGAINAGGNNRTLGNKMDGSDWRVRIQNPNGDGKMIIVQEKGVFSFVTSGDYERFYVGDDNRKYHHIIDPSTLFPAVNYRSVTIITPDSGVADCMSTTLFTMSLEEGLSVIEQYKKANPGTRFEAVWIMDDQPETSAVNIKKAGDFYVAWTDGLSDSLIFELE